MLGVGYALWYDQAKELDSLAAMGGGKLHRVADFFSLMAGKGLAADPDEDEDDEDEQEAAVEPVIDPWAGLELHPLSDDDLPEEMNKPADIVELRDWVRLTNMQHGPSPDG